jgi:AsmA protein
MTVSEAGGKTRAYDGVSLVAENLSYTSQFPFQFSANTPGQGTVKLTGQAGPVNTSDASMTPLHAEIDVQHFDLSSTGFVDPYSGLGGLVNFNGQVDSDGKLIDSHGSVTATSLKLTAGAAPSTVPLDVDYETTYDPKNQTGTLKQGNVHVGKAVANLTGTFSASENVPTVQMKMVGQGMSVPDLEGVLPAVGVKLPSGASLQSGTLDATLTITGPVDKLVIAGPVTLSNAKMAGFSLTGALGALSSFAGLAGGGGQSAGSDTEIQTLKADMRIDPSGQHAKNVDLVVPAIGTVTGSGNASANGDLDCKMVASLAGVGGALTDVLGGGKSKGIPFTIKGTTSHPEFIPDVGGMAKGFVTGSAGTAGGAAGAAQSALGGLLGKKKQ